MKLFFTDILNTLMVLAVLLGCSQVCFASRIKLACLYIVEEQDQILACHLKRKSDNSDSETTVKPTVFFTTVNRYATATSDFGDVDDTRSFTSEALLSKTRLKRLNRSLTKDKLKAIIRTRDQFETLNRIRFCSKYGAMDIFYRYGKINGVQITNFDDPTEFNDVELNEYGIALETPLHFLSDFNFNLRGAYKRIERKGVVEHKAYAEENINQFEGIAVFPQFLGSEKTNLEFKYVFQDIDPTPSGSTKRERKIFSTKLTQYTDFPSFAKEGSKVSCGVAYDKESYSDVDIIKSDLFFGTSIRGINDGAFDVNFNPTFFICEVKGKDSRDNLQFRTDLSLLYRLLNEEKKSLHLKFPLRYDFPLHGVCEFENFRTGFELGGDILYNDVTFSVSTGYAYQYFFDLQEGLNLFNFNISMAY